MRNIDDTGRWIGGILVGFLALTLSAGDPVFAETALTEHTFTLDEGEEPGPATIADVAWLAGSWGGEALDGEAEEIWTPPRGSAMLGMFRLLKDEQPVFFELMTLTEREGRVVLRLKHFDPDLTGWESRDETVDFPLIRFTDTALFFDGLTFERDGDDRILVYLAMSGDDGTREETFEYVRAGARDAGEPAPPGE